LLLILSVIFDLLRLDLKLSRVRKPYVRVVPSTSKKETP
jgi:hypothetical protein